MQKLLVALDAQTQQQVVPHLAPFSQLLAGFLDDTNFKISLTSLQMISDILDRFGEQIRNGPDSLAVASAIVPRLMEKFADNKIVIRQSNLKLMKKLMGIVPAERVLPPLLAYLQHTNSHIREMAINVLIQTLLSAPRQPIDLYRSALAALSRNRGVTRTLTNHGARRGPHFTIVAQKCAPFMADVKSPRCEITEPRLSILTIPPIPPPFRRG